MVCGAVHVGWQGEEDGSIAVTVWYLNRVRPRRGDAPWSVAELSFAGVEHVSYSTEGVFLVTTPESPRESSPSEPWLEVEPFAATPQGPSVLYWGRDSELLRVIGGWDFDGSHPAKDRAQLIHFSVPRSHEGELDVVGRSVRVREIWCEEEPLTVEHLANGVRQWSGAFPD